MTLDIQRRNKQRQRMVIFSFGLFMLLYVASKNPNLPSEWTGMHKVESGIQIPKSSSECGSD
jgi:hypothetical protein